MKSTKRFRLRNDRDRISNLPEAVLSNILSRLPTKDVVRTSILSKDWEYKWTSIDNVSIDDNTNNDYYYIRSPLDPKAPTFAAFMDRILIYCKYLKKFHLHCGSRYNMCRAQRWINTALRCNLESLDVQCEREEIVYPTNLLNSDLLRNLRLCGHSKLIVDMKNIATDLTSLYLLEAKIMNSDPYTNTTVAFTFPVLETITLESCEWLYVESLEIDAPLLTTFTSIQQKCGGNNPSFVISAPRLAKFSSHGLPGKFILENASSIVSASLCCEEEVTHLDLRKGYGVVVGDLLNKLTNLEELRLSGSIAKLGPPLGCHDKLRRLYMVGKWIPEHIYYILNALPSLKVLTVLGYIVDWDFGPKQAIRERETDIRRSCTVSQLEEVQFFDTCWHEASYRVVKFLMKNGERLRKISLSGFIGRDDLRRDKLKVVSKLSDFPNRSRLHIEY